MIVDYNVKICTTNYYQSNDFYASAFLIANGYELADYKRSKGHTTFFFEESGELKNLIKKFYSLTSSIEPVKYSQALRALKGVIHSDTLALSTSYHGLNNNEITTRKDTK